ncbi:MAG: ABC transporter permease [Pseudomonadota bacterium]
MVIKNKAEKQLSYHYTDKENLLVLKYAGDIAIHDVQEIWSTSLSLLEHYHPHNLIIDLDAVNNYSDAFVHLLCKLKTVQQRRSSQFKFKSEQYALINLFNLYDQIEDEALTKVKKLGIIETVGMAAINLWHTIQQSFVFIGELLLKSWRIKNFLGFFAKEIFESGPKALFITALMGFILGVILTYQGVLVLALFGAQVYVVNMVVIALTREIVPLMTAFIVAGRSVAAFAAEIGSMNVNQEIDALQTMKIDKMSFLILPKILSIILTIPVLNLYMLFFGIIGCGVIFVSLGYPVEFYYSHLKEAFLLLDLIGGLVKVTVFGAIIACVGCAYGLNAKKGAGAVGMATTKSVVTSIVLIIIADGIFSVVFYKLGI